MDQLTLPFPYHGQTILDANNITKFDYLLRDPLSALADVDSGPARITNHVVTRDRKEIGAQFSWHTSVKKYNELDKAARKYALKKSNKGHFRCDVCSFCCAECDHPDDYDLCDVCLDNTESYNGTSSPVITNMNLIAIHDSFANLLPRVNLFGFQGIKNIHRISTTYIPVAFDLIPTGKGEFTVTATMNFLSAVEHADTRKINEVFDAFFPTNDSKKERFFEETTVVIHLAYTLKGRNTEIDWDRSVALAYSPAKDLKVGFPLCYIMDGFSLPENVKAEIGEEGVALRLAFKNFINPIHLFDILTTPLNGHTVAPIGKLSQTLRFCTVLGGASQQIFKDRRGDSINRQGSHSSSWHSGSLCTGLLTRKLSGMSAREEISHISSGANSKLSPKLFKVYLQTVQLVPQAEPSRSNNRNQTLVYNAHHCDTCAELNLYSRVAEVFKSLSKTLNHNSIKALFADNIPSSRAFSSIAHSIELLCTSSIFHSLSEQRKFSILKSAIGELVLEDYNRAAMLISDTGNTLFNIEKRSVEDIREARSNLKGKDIRTIKLFHDELSYIYTALKTKPIEVNQDFYQFLENKTDVDDTYEIKIPRNNIDVITWGQTQSHCIGTYADNAVKGTSLLLGVWDKKNDTWFGHLSMSPLVEAGFFNTDKVNLKNPLVLRRTVAVSQFYGHSNCALDASEKAKITEHLQKCVDEWFEYLAESLDLKPPAPPVNQTSISGNYLIRQEARNAANNYHIGPQVGRINLHRDH